MQIKIEMSSHKDSQNGIISGIVILVVGGLILAWLTGMFSVPPIIRVTQNNEEVCQQYLSFNSEKISSFEIKLKNEGKTAEAYALIEGVNFTSKAKDNEEFGNSSKELWIISSKEIQSFDFKILIKDYPKNLSIEVDYGCKNLLCPKYTFCCNYNLYGANDYIFTKESLSC